jgi:hypothetical protein
MTPERPATSGKRSNAALREFLGIANVDFLSLPDCWSDD